MEPDTGAAQIFDRYRASSVKAYNVKPPDRYDTAIALSVLRCRRLNWCAHGVIGLRAGP